jgi:3-isopropylmalate dehydrogenase
MDYNISILVGDGHGVQLAQTMADILSAIKVRFGHSFKYSYPKLGGSAIDKTGQVLPQQTIEECKKSDAILIGAIGGKNWHDSLGIDQARIGIHQLYQEIKMAVCITPISSIPDLNIHSPFKRHLNKKNTNICFFYPCCNINSDQQTYIERLCQVAFEQAKSKKQPIISVDMSDSLESDVMWRESIKKYATNYSDIKIEYMQAKDFSVLLSHKPDSINYVLTNFTLGNLLSNQTCCYMATDTIATGTIGFNKLGIYGTYGFCSSAKIQPNPIGAILSTALMLSSSLGLYKETICIERALKHVVKSHKPLELGGNINCDKFAELVGMQIISS